MPWTPPPKEVKKKSANPIWAGIGFILIPVYFGGSYFLATWFVQQNYKQGWLPILFELPPQQQMIGIAAIIFVFAFAVSAIVYGMIVGPPVGEHDVRVSSGRRPRKRY